MIKNRKFNNFFVTIYQLYHPQFSKEALDFYLVILNIFPLLQIIDLIDLQSIPINSESNQLVLIIRGLSFYNILSNSNKQDLIFVIFIFNLIVVALLYFLFRNNNSGFVKKTLQVCLIIQGTVFTIPFIKISTDIIIWDYVCDSFLCSQENMVVLQIIGAVNIVMSFIFLISQILFCRADKLQEDSNFTTLRYNLIETLLRHVSKIVLVILSFFKLGSSFMIVMTQIYLIYNYFESVIQRRVHNYDLCLNVIMLTLNICIYIQVNITELMSILTVMVCLNISIHQKLIQQLITNKNQCILQVASVIYHVTYNNKGSNPYLAQVIKSNHKCLKCKDFRNICKCVLKRIMLNNKDERNILIYSNYISNKKPVKALINTLESKNNDWYHKIAYQQSIKELNIQILRKQELSRKSQTDVNIDVNTVRKSVEYKTEAIQQYIRILRRQLLLWKGLIQGLKYIEDYVIEIKGLAKLMLTCKKLISFLNVEQQNVISMRVIQIYHATIYYNPRLVYSLENDINEILRTDRYKIDQSLNNYVLYEDRYLLLNVSLIQNIGYLINPDQTQIAKFLGSSIELVDIRRMDDLMPLHFSKSHYKFINNYIHNGTTQYDRKSIQIYLQKPEGFIFSANLQLDYKHDTLNDFIMTALICKQQNNNKIILFSNSGQILGMEQSVYEFIKDLNDGFQTTINEIISQGALIQLFIRNISQAVKQLKTLIESAGNTNLSNFVDQWNVGIDHKKSLKFCNSLYTSIQETLNDQTTDIQNVSFPIDQFIENNNAQTKNVIYNLDYFTHNYKEGQLSYYRVTILDDDIGAYQFSQKNPSSRNSVYKIQVQPIDEISLNDSPRIDMSSIQQNNNYKFITPQTPLNQTFKETKQQDEEYFIEKYDKSFDQNQYMAKINMFEKKPKEEKKKQSMRRNKNFGDISSIHSSQSSSNKEYEIIINQLQSHNRIVKPLLTISGILIGVLISILIIIMLNILTIQSNVNNQLQQINLLRKPQNISYVYTSILTQSVFKCTNLQGTSQQSPFIIYWNNLQLDYMNDYIYSMMQSLAVSVPLLSSSFNIYEVQGKTYKENQLITSIIKLEEFYDQFIQYFLITYNQSSANDSNIIYIETKGFIRQNIVMIIKLHSQVIQQLTQSITDSQLQVMNNYIYLMAVELIIVIILFTAQVKWWQNMDTISLDIMSIIQRLTFYQANLHVIRIEQVVKQLENIESNDWINKNQGETMFETEKVTITQKDQSSTKQLLSRFPQDNYFNKSNYIGLFTLLMFNIIFNVIGYIIYNSKNSLFQPSLLSMSNYVSFLHNVDASMLYGSLIKLDSVLVGNDVSLINQSEIISTFQNYSNQLQPQLNNFVNFIYGSQLASNQKFNQLLYQNLCNFQSDKLVMCDTSLLQYEYWDQDDYTNLVSQGMLGYTNQYIKYVYQEFFYEFDHLQYQPNLTLIKNSIQSKTFQNFFLQYFLDMQEVLRQFLTLFLSQNQGLGLDIIIVVEGYFLGFGLTFLLIMAYIFYRWIMWNQEQMNLLRQMIGIIPTFQNNSANFRAYIYKIYSKLF
ncbi:hypothetical protein pb186bvf_017157 [Paramecium bursaria]